MNVKNEVPGPHLTDDELCALAVPTVAPEPLPAHLSRCLACSRLLAEWKDALRDLGEEDEELIARRPAEQWRAAEEATLLLVRGAGAPGRVRARTVRWALPAAAALLLVGLLIGQRRSEPPVAFDDTAGLSVEDRADDALLRDVDRLASGEEAGSWSGLVPDPAESEAATDGENRS